SRSSASQAAKCTTNSWCVASKAFTRPSCTSFSPGGRVRQQRNLRSPQAAAVAKAPRKSAGATREKGRAPRSPLRAVAAASQTRRRKRNAREAPRYPQPMA
ncbi:unnamed protein product, partial [Ectocarpus sp. 12 AP-2014]